MGLEKITQDLKRLRGVKVGLLESSGNYPDGTSIVDVGIYNEYGTSRSPARPFMAVTADQAGSEMQAYVSHTIGLMMDGRITPTTVDNNIGRVWADNTKKVIDGFDVPPNAPSTVLKKGKNDPLIDTGRMRNAINWERL